MSTDPNSAFDPRDTPQSFGGWQPPTANPQPQPQSAPEPQFGAYGAPPAGSYGQPAVDAGSQPWQQAQPQYPGGFGAPFTVAPKPGIIPLRPLTFGEILEGSFQALRVNPKAMFVPALLVMAAIGVLAAAVNALVLRNFDLTAMFDPSRAETIKPEDSLMSSLAMQSGSLLTAFLNLFATAILSGLLIVAVSRSVLGRVADLGETWQRTKRRIWALIGQTLLIQLIVIATVLVCALLAVAILTAGAGATSGFDNPSVATIIAIGLSIMVLVVAVIAAALFFQTRLLVAPAALILEDVGVIDSIKRSWQLTKGSFWRVLGMNLVISILVSIVSGTLGGIFGMAGGLSIVLSPKAFALFLSLTTFLTSVVTGLVLPFQAAANALIYIDLRMRKEGLDVDLRRSAA
ncbi:glycerophosphoryl diester phosphodiesterase membrane domain-containing protein [Actinomyces bovis]|nr:glycerophosphoryl diester phosphodiesterase membrane domain-containing protein [Actinomyces bovis]